MRLHRINIVIIIAALTILIRCAHPVAPTGGPKDITPPNITSAAPPNGSILFTGKKFVLYTDEFVVLQNVLQSALISPPMRKLPDYSTRGKSIHVKFNEPLLENTTYSIYFGDAITDLTENNPLHNFTYLLSTGDYVDSLSLFGTVQSAFNLLPEEQVLVLLYKDNNDTIRFDSLPMLVPPYYVSKTDAEGRFSFRGLSMDKYLIFALKDQNTNYIFDQPGEEIAFIDSLVMPFYEQPVANVSKPDEDSLTEVLIDTLQLRLDSIRDDSLFRAKFEGIELFMFTQYDSTQRLLKAEVLKKNILQFSFAQPAGQVEIEPVNFNPDTLWHLARYSPHGDTVTWYLHDLPIDTLQCLIKTGEDTLGHAFLKLDPSKTNSRARQNKKNQERAYLEWKSNVNRSNLRPDQHLKITFNQPMVSMICDSSMFKAGGDTIYNPEFRFMDSLHQTIEFPVPIVEDEDYVLFFPDSAFVDWNGLGTKEITIRFKSKALREYGTFTLDLKPEHNQDYIFQMLTEKEALYRELFFDRDTTIHLDYLDPGKYIFKMIYDNNGNHRWDAGNFPHRIQPEKVIYFPKEVNVRANWEVEEAWEW